MRVTSIQTIEYLKVHLAYNGIKTGFLTSLRFLERIAGKAAEQTAAIVVVLLPASLASFAVVRVSEAWILTAYCCDVCNMLPVMLITL